MSDVHKALDNLFSTYPRIVYDGDLIEFEIIVRVDEAFVALLALLENIPIKLIKICDKGYTKILFEISTKNTWLLLCLDCWISTQEIHGYYGFYTGCFYEHPILSCNQINKLENLNEDMSCINQNFSKTNSVFSLIMDDYYSPIINKAFKQYVKTEQIWSSELMLYILTKCFFPNAIHIYKANWLGKLSLDIYIPSLKIGIEYQGEQHFKEGPFGKTKEDLAVQQERDNRKKELCTKNDINLIEWTYKETFANALDFANAFNLKVRKPIIKIDAQREIYNHLSLKFKDLLKTYFYES